MAITLTYTPERIEGGITSRFVAAYNPINFEFQYSNVGSFSASGLGVINNQLFIQLADLGTEQVGDFLKLTKLSDGLDIVTSIVRIDSVNLRYFVNLTTNIGYSNTVKNWYQRDYFLNVIVEVEGNEIATTSVYPFSDGVIEFNPEQYIQNELLNIDNFDYVTTQYKDVESSKSFVLKYQEYFNGGLQGTEAETETFTAIAAANQIQNANGSNLIDNIINPNNTVILSKFASPKVWAGYPFSLDILTKGGTTSNTIETPNGTINLNVGDFDAVNRIAFNTSNITNLNTCISSGTVTPPLNSFIWNNFVCEVTPTTSLPVSPLVPPIPAPSPPPVSPPAFCGLSLSSSGGAGITQYALQINYTGYIAALVDAATVTDMFNIGKLQADGVTADYLATSHMTNVDPALDIYVNTGINEDNVNVNTASWDVDVATGGQKRFLSGDAKGAGVASFGSDAVVQYVGGIRPTFPNRIAEYRTATGDNTTDILNKNATQVIWMPVTVGDVAVLSASGKAGTFWRFLKVWCYQTN